MKIKLLIVSFVVVAVLSAAAPAARAWWLIDQLGQLTEIGTEGQVLGEGSGQEGGQEIKAGEEQRGEFKIEKPNESKTEIRFSDENRTKTEFKPGESKTEIRQGETKLRLERKDGQIRMKFKNEATGEERELEIRKEAEMRLREKTGFEKPKTEEPETEIEAGREQEILRIREREDRSEVRIGSDNGRFVINRNQVGAVSDFPLSVDLTTNTLSVTTPAGEKQVTVLPDQAVQNMLARNVIDRIGDQEAGNFSGRIRMSQKPDGTLTYEIDGEKQERLLGLMRIKFKKTAVVSAETGELVETKQAFTDRILELISF